MSRARTSLGFAAFALASGVALGHTHADPAPSFTGLPAASLPAMPGAQTAPGDIPAEARVDSLSLRRNPSRFGLQSARGGFWIDAHKGWCMTESPGTDISPARSNASISRARGVVAVRIERLDTDRGTGATLEVRDVWIDAATLGVQIASIARLPLARLAGGPGGFAVYGFRDGRTAHVIVPAANAMAFRDASGQTGMTTCGHIRLPLVAEPRSGSMALVMGTVPVPSNARPSPKHAVLTSATNPAGHPASPAAPQASPSPPIATRTVRVSASLSQTSQEREPVFSVALGWDDPQEMAPVPSAPPVTEGPPPPVARPQLESALPTKLPAAASVHREIDFEGK